MAVAVKEKTEKCLIIRDREHGGIVDENITESKLPKDSYKHSIFGKRMHMLVDKKGNNEFTSFALPDEVIITPEKVARIPGCDPWQRYKTTIKTRWDQLKPMVPVVVIIIDCILLVIIRG